MLWNWYTVDTCFLSSSWHNRSKGMFAGSIVGVFFLVIAIEALRRAGREYDRNITKAALACAVAAASGSPSVTKSETESGFTPNTGCAPVQ